MRKSLLLSLPLLLGCTYANARQISPSEAMTLATDFMNSAELSSAKVAKSLTPMKAPGMNAESQNSPYFIFNRGEAEGFVIISGDDRAPKILGYSDKGSFDAENLPPQLKAMMEQWAKQMENLPASAEQHSSWTAAPATRAGEGVLLETAEWGQGYPYNALCPMIDGIQAPVGCGATAMAIVMKYHNWPESTHGVTYTNYNNRNQTIDYSSQSIDWSVLSGSADTEEYKEEISKLNELIAVAIDTEFGFPESSSDFSGSAHRLTEFFKYSPTCEFLEKKQFESIEWNSIIRSQIDSKLPVLYFGNSGPWTPGHAFVIDGYAGGDLYHINWGWDGSINGYFTLDALTPDYRDFSQNSGIIIDIFPDRSGKTYSRPFMHSAEIYLNDLVQYNDYNFNVDVIKPNEPFTFITPKITLPWEYAGYFGVAIMDKEDNIVEMLFNEDLSNLGNDVLYAKVEDGCGAPGISLKLTYVSPGLSEGQRYQLICRDEDSAEWKPILGGRLHKTYFHDTDIISDMGLTKVYYDESAPMFLSHDLTEGYRDFKGDGLSFHIYTAGGYVEPEVRVYDKDGSEYDPVFYYFPYNRNESYGFGLSCFHDFNDITIKWRKFENNRHDWDKDPSSIIDKDGLVYELVEDEAFLIGHDGFNDVSLVIPNTVEVNGKEYKVVAIENNALTSNESIKHIDMGKNIRNIYPYGIGLMSYLESVSFAGSVDIPWCAAVWSKNLKNVYLLSEEAHDCAVFNLTPQFDGSWFNRYVREDFNVYTCVASGKEINETWEILPCEKHFYVPGMGKAIEDPMADEMWSYVIDRDHNAIKIEPRIDELKILSVIVNGQNVESDENCVYAVPSVQDMEVTVNYILNDHQEMTTVYDAAYNEGLPSQTITQAVEGINNGNTVSEVYTLDGVLVNGSADENSLKTLTPGIYILRSGGEMKKVVIR